MAKLEREAGRRLLERHGRGVRLTDAAVLLAGHAEHMPSPAGRAEADLEAHRGTVAGRSTLAAFATAAQGLGPGALRALHRDHPRLRVTVEEAEPHGAEPEIAHTAAEHHTRLALVAGLGPPRDHDGRAPVPGGIRFAEVSPPPTRRVYAVWRAGADRRPAIRVAIKALRDAAPHAGRAAAAGQPPSWRATRGDLHMV